MSKLREIIRDERQRRQGLARGPRIVMWITWEPILSPAGDRVVGKRQTGARAEIIGDPRRLIWEQHDGSLEVFKMRVEAEAEMVSVEVRKPLPPAGSAPRGA